MDQILVYLIAVVVHELGHLSSFFLLGLRMPRIKLANGGVLLESDQLLILPTWMTVHVILGGVLAGAIVLFALGAEPWTWSGYILACAIDINELWCFITAPKRMLMMPSVFVFHELYNKVITRAVREWSLVEKKKVKE
jgi:hypothetical protein